MSRTRLSTTVDTDLLESARSATGKPDSALVDEALAALLSRHRSAEVSRDAVIPRHRRVLVAPCTTTIRHLPSEVLLEPGEDPVPLRSAVNLDSIESVSIAILVERLGRVADARMREICAALAIAVDCSS